MAKSLLVINVDIRETRVALIENGIIAELHIERESSRGTLGNIYLGKVSRVLPGMQAAFIDVGLERAAFLHVEDLIRPDDFEAYLAGHRRGHGAEDRSARPASREPAPAGQAGEGEADDAVLIALPTAAEVSDTGAEIFNNEEDAADAAAAAAELAEEEELEREREESELQAEEDESNALRDAEGEGDVEIEAAGAEAETDTSADADADVDTDRDTGTDADTDTDTDTDADRGADADRGVDAGADIVAADAEGEPAEGEGEVARAEGEIAAGEEEPRAAEGTTESAARQSEEVIAQPVAMQRGRGRRGSRQGRVRRSGSTADRRPPIAEGAGGEAGSGGEGDNRSAARGRSGGGGEQRGGRGRQGEEGGGRAGGREGGAREGGAREGAREGAAREGGAREGGAREGGAREGGREGAREGGREGARGGGRDGGRGGRDGGRGGRGGRDGGRGGRDGGRGGREGGRENSRDNARGGRENTRDAGARARSLEPPRVSKATPIREVVREGQEVIVQISKEPIGTKGARVTSHISLPGRYVVYLPTVEHVGISKRIGSEKERARLRESIEAMKPPQGGIIVRTLAEGLTKKQLKADVGYLVRLWGEVAKKRESGVRAPTCIYTELDLVLRTARDLFTDDIEKIVIDSRDEFGRLKRFVEMFMPERTDAVELYEGDEPIFDAYGIEDEIQRALARKVPLPSGGYLIIDQAEALTAIDVNTGRFVGKGSKDLEETILATNLEAVEEIAYQLRFRNIGGLIILDLIDMERASNREKVRRRLEELLAKDKAKTTLNRISDLGLIEMTRKRTRESLGRTVLEPCFYCDGTGQLQSKQTIAYEILRQIRRERHDLAGYVIVVNAHPAVVDFLKSEERMAVQEAERLFTRRIELVPRKEYHLEQFDLQGK